MSVHIAALYRFARFEEPARLVAPLEEACRAEGVKGTLLVAHEGINGTIAGGEAGLARALDAVRRITGLADIDVKRSEAQAAPFLRMKVKLKREIVTIGDASVDPLKAAGTYVEARDWNALIADPDVVLIDVRNDYEHRIGTFRGAVDPETASFSEFPAFVRERLSGAKDKTIAMFCTGGIRCEKASAFMLQEGFAKVFHLKGGILRYLEEAPEGDSLWTGGCFVFDERVAVGHGLAPDGRYTLCHGCRRPLTAEDCSHPDHEEGVRCRHCAGEMTPARLASARERHRQMRLAARRGEAHIGPDAQRPDGPQEQAPDPAD
jgi:UPF0176 protein